MIELTQLLSEGQQSVWVNRDHVIYATDYSSSEFTGGTILWTTVGYLLVLETPAEVAAMLDPAQIPPELA